MSLFRAFLIIFISLAQTSIALAECLGLDPPTPKTTNICEILVKDLVLPRTELFCDNGDFPEAFFIPPHCHIPSACHIFGECKVFENVREIGSTLFKAGDLYCDTRELAPEEIITGISKQAYADLNHLTTGGTSSILFEITSSHIDAMKCSGEQLNRDLKQWVDCVSSKTDLPKNQYFHSIDVDRVRILPKRHSTANIYLTSGNAAITLDDVVIFKNPSFDILSNWSKKLGEYLTVPEVDALALLIHELVHVRQYRNLGAETFINSLLPEFIMSPDDVDERPHEAEADTFENIARQIINNGVCEFDSTTSPLTLSNFRERDLLEVGSFRIRNRHMGTVLENSGLSAIISQPGALIGTEWVFEKVGSTRYYRIKKFGTNQYLHVENGTPELISNVDTGWVSAMWFFEGLAGTEFVRIKNRWKSQYLHTESGELELITNINKKWYSGMWSINGSNEIEFNDEGSSSCKIELFTPAAVGPYCPNKEDGHLNYGNRHLDGPVKVDVNHRVYYGENDELDFILKLGMTPLRGTETREKVSATWTEKGIYKPPTGKVVHAKTFDAYDNPLSGESTRKVLPESGTEIGPCNNGESHEVGFSNESFLPTVKVIADTGNDDISEDRDCGCDSEIKSVEFKPITICLQEEEQRNRINATAFENIK